MSSGPEALPKTENSMFRAMGAPAFTFFGGRWTQPPPPASEQPEKTRARQQSRRAVSVFILGRDVFRELFGGEGGEQVAQFGVDVFGARDGLGDFFAKELAVALAQAVKGDAHGRFGEMKLCCELGVRGVGGASGEAGEQRVELAGMIVFGAEACGDRIEKGEGPRAVEGEIRSERIASGRVDRRFGGRRVERRQEVGAAFFGAGVVAEICEIVVERAEEKGAEASAFTAGGGEGFEAEEAGEETLHGVVGVGGGETAAAGVGEERCAVERAEFAEGAIGAFAGGEDKRPAGGGESVAHLMK